MTSQTPIGARQPNSELPSYRRLGLCGIASPALEPCTHWMFAWGQGNGQPRPHVIICMATSADTRLTSQP